MVEVISPRSMSTEVFSAANTGEVVGTLRLFRDFPQEKKQL